MLKENTHTHLLVRVKVAGGQEALGEQLAVLGHKAVLAAVDGHKNACHVTLAACTREVCGLVNE